MARTKIGGYTKAQLFSLPDGVYRLEKYFYLRVRANGKYRSYFFRYTDVQGRQRDISLGSARKRTMNEVKQQVCFYKNLIAVTRGLNSAGIAEFQRIEPVTFKEYSRKIIEVVSSVRMWKNPAQRQSWLSSIEAYALPAIGEKKIHEINRIDILKVLEPIWLSKTMTAAKLRGRLETIFNYAISDGLYDGPNPAAWKSNLDKYLPPPEKCANVAHFSALKLDELKPLVQKITNSNHIGEISLLFGILTATRTVEFTQMHWNEVDFDNSVWICPHERRKDSRKEPFRVPLAKQALDLLIKLSEKKQGEYVFSADGKSPIRRETPGKALKGLVETKCTMHGMRSTFRDWCASNSINDTLAEKCLMHSSGNKVVLAYQRSDLLENRREVMQKWADELYRN